MFCLQQTEIRQSFKLPCPLHNNNRFFFLLKAAMQKQNSQLHIIQLIDQFLRNAAFQKNCMEFFNDFRIQFRTNIICKCLVQFLLDIFFECIYAYRTSCSKIRNQSCCTAVFKGMIFHKPYAIVTQFFDGFHGDCILVDIKVAVSMAST